MNYFEKMAKKYRIPYINIEKIYIGSGWNTYLESDGDGKWKLVSPSAILKVNDDGSLYISGNVLIDSPIRISGSINTNSSIICNSITTNSFEQKAEL